MAGLAAGSAGDLLGPLGRVHVARTGSTVIVAGGYGAAATYLRRPTADSRPV